MNTVDPIRNVEEIELLKSALHGRNKLMFIIGINTNLRVSDLLQLRAEHFANMDANGRVTIKEQKTSKSKTFYANEAVRQAIAELAPEAGYLFPSQKGSGEKPISRVQAWRILNNAADRCNLSHINFGTHTMRKTFAYHAHKNGTPLPTLMKVLNHSSQRETLIYIGIEQQEIDDVYINVNL